MPLTYVAIQTVSLTSTQSSISFTSIPQTYTDLCLLVSTRSATNGAFSDELIRFNDSSSNFTNMYFYGNGSNVLPGRDAYNTGFVAGMPGNTATNNAHSNKWIYIPRYASTSVNKIYMVNNGAETNATTAYIHGIVGLWSQTSAITSITLVTDSGANYLANSTATLYGIKNS